jgi:chromosome segregation ATPase
MQQKLTEKEAAFNAINQEHFSKSQLASDSQNKIQVLTEELQRATAERDEHKHQASQLQQRMNVTMQQVNMLQSELQEKQSQLTSTQVRLKQVENMKSLQVSS